MKKYIYLTLKVALLGIIFYIIGKEFYLNWDEIVSYQWRPDPFYLVASFLMFIVSYLYFYLVWYAMQRAISIKLPFFEGARIWALANLGKYLPGHIWLVLGRISYLTASGVSKKRAVLSSYMEIILILP